MTFSLLAYDRETGSFAAAAATGSLCVGGWVLRGGCDSGLVASQGTAPSTLWRDNALQAMQHGSNAQDAVRGVTEPDAGRDYRQLAALDPSGGTAAFTGAHSVDHAAHETEHVDREQPLHLRAAGSLPDRLIAALRAAETAGSDFRGLLSAALLVLSPDKPPLDLRVDYAAQPIDALAMLNAHAHASPYADWLNVVPVLSDPSRAPKTAE